VLGVNTKQRSAPRDVVELVKDQHKQTPVGRLRLGQNRHLSCLTRNVRKVIAVYKSLVSRAFSSFFEKLTLAWGLDDLNLVKLNEQPYPLILDRFESG
jgi:hypothetical protein